MNTFSTGSYIAFAGIIVSALAHFNIVIPQDGVVAVLAGAVSLYGIIHQLLAHKKAIQVGALRV